MKNPSTTLARQQEMYARAENQRGSTEEAALLVAERDLLTQQTGNFLVGLGQVFVNVPFFSSHVSQATANRLISIGKKLARNSLPAAS